MARSAIAGEIPSQRAGFPAANCAGQRPAGSPACPSGGTVVPLPHARFLQVDGALGRQLGQQVPEEGVGFGGQLDHAIERQPAGLGGGGEQAAGHGLGHHVGKVLGREIVQQQLSEPGVELVQRVVAGLQRVDIANQLANDRGVAGSPAGQFLGLVAVLGGKGLAPPLAPGVGVGLILRPAQRLQNDVLSSPLPRTLTPPWLSPRALTERRGFVYCSTGEDRPQIAGGENHASIVQIPLHPLLRVDQFAKCGKM